MKPNLIGFQRWRLASYRSSRFCSNRTKLYDCVHEIIS